MQVIDHPSWSLINFDVHCARCGQDLRGQIEPVCPACKLEFTWEQAAPLEHLTCGQCNYHLYGLSDSRCPECGTSVDWNEALLRYRRREKPLFEYRWRDRPIRSFFYTWLLALRPNRFWKRTNLHDSPRLLPLILWLFLLFGAVAVSIPSGVALGSWVRWVAFLPRTATQFANLFADMLLRVVGTTWNTLTGGIGYPSPTTATYVIVGVVGLWCAFSFLSLLLLRRSMARCKIRVIHVFRVCAYCLLVNVPIALLILGLLRWEYVWRFAFPYADRILFDNILLVGLFFANVTWSIRQGYHHYLKMPHSLAVAIASQVIAVSATLLVPTILFWSRHARELWNL